VNPDAAQALFAWPAQAAVGRVLAKSKIYEYAKPGAALRAQFVAQVEQIHWAYKLAPESINLPARAGAPEIEVFQIALKTPSLDESLLRSIDRAIPFPILFELQFEGRSQAVATYKRPSEADAMQWVLSDYFATPWQATEAARPGLPIALDLLGLYEDLLRAHLPLAARPGESLRAQVDRLASLRSAEATAHRLSARLAREKQFNRKVELNTQLRTIRHQLDTLSR
jgi:hypothetical protein